MAASRLRLYANIQHSAHLLKKAADRELMTAAGVTTAQAAVMAVVAAEEQPTQKAVAEALGLNESAMTAMIKRLIALGYIDRQTCANDGRARQLSLTLGGVTALEHIGEPFARINRRLEKALGVDGIAVCAGYNKKIADEFAV